MMNLIETLRIDKSYLSIHHNWKDFHPNYFNNQKNLIFEKFFQTPQTKHHLK